MVRLCESISTRIVSETTERRNVNAANGHSIRFPFYSFEALSITCTSRRVFGITWNYGSKSTSEMYSTDLTETCLCSNNFQLFVVSNGVYLRTIVIYIRTAGRYLSGNEISFWKFETHMFSIFLHEYSSAAGQIQDEISREKIMLILALPSVMTIVG